MHGNNLGTKMKIGTNITKFKRLKCDFLFVNIRSIGRF